jgi:phosphatidylserine/phosphatidylglycerophosphate/cardiolipin synthase-like enzyme
MKRGVNIAVVVPSKSEDPVVGPSQKYQRDIGVNYLQSVRSAGAPGHVVVASLKNGTTDIYVHSKLMIVDDEFVLIGSANVGQRSMSHDGELHIGVLDSANLFAKELRKTLWAEHTGRPAGTLDAPVAAYSLFESDVGASAGHLMPYPSDPLAVYPAVAGSTPPPARHTYYLLSVIDPYAGPPGLR